MIYLEYLKSRTNITEPFCLRNVYGVARYIHEENKYYLDGDNVKNHTKKIKVLLSQLSKRKQSPTLPLFMDLWKYGMVLGRMVNTVTHGRPLRSDFCVINYHCRREN